jgi:protein SEY1
MISMANATSTQALEEGKKRLREFLEASDTKRHPMAMSSGESYEMSKLNRSRGKARSVADEEAEEEEDI